MNIFYFPPVPATLIPPNIVMPGAIYQLYPRLTTRGKRAEQPTYSYTAGMGIPLMCDAHIRKIALESVQMLFTWAWQRQSLEEWFMEDEDRYACAYRPTHEGHPLVEWMNESLNNVRWMGQYAHLLLLYYKTVTGKIHLSHRYYLGLLQAIYGGHYSTDWRLADYHCPSTLPMCVPEQYHVCLRGTGAVNPQLSYVNYYVNEKLNQPWCQFNYDRPGKLAILAIWERYRQRFTR